MCTGIKIMAFIADTVLFFHLVIVIFVTFGFILVPVGYKFNWKWTVNAKLRIFHLGLILLITMDTILGITCPLTFIENSLREFYISDTFVRHWLKQLIYWDFPTIFFMFLYSACLCWTVLMWKLFPPLGKKAISTKISSKPHIDKDS